MTDDRHRRLHTVVVIAAVLIGHAALIAALALAGEWRVWRFIVNVTAQLYAVAGLGWMLWHFFAAPLKRRRP